MGRVLATLTTTAMYSGKVPLMAAVAESPNTASPCNDKNHGWVGKLEEVMAKLGVENCGQWRDASSAWVGRSSSVNGGSVSLFWRWQREGEGMGAAAAFCGNLRSSRANQWGRDQRTAATAHPRGGIGLRPVGHRGLKKLNRFLNGGRMTDWQTNFDAVDLPNQAELVQTIHNKVGDGYVIYNFVNTGSSWFSMVCKLQASQGGYFETVSVIDLANFY
jgi:hypothetical protein